MMMNPLTSRNELDLGVGLARHGDNLAHSLAAQEVLVLNQRLHLELHVRSVALRFETEQVISESGQCTAKRNTYQAGRVFEHVEDPPRTRDPGLSRECFDTASSSGHLDIRLDCELPCLVFSVVALGNVGCLNRPSRSQTGVRNQPDHMLQRAPDTDFMVAQDRDHADATSRYEPDRAAIIKHDLADLFRAVGMLR